MSYAAQRLALRIKGAILARACYRGDTQADTAALLAEVLQQPDYAMADLAEHFEGEAERWRIATGAGREYGRPNSQSSSATAGTGRHP